jgi:hypothetical protein
LEQDHSFICGNNRFSAETFFPGEGGKGIVENLSAFIVGLSVYSYPDIRALPAERGQRPVEGKQFRMIVEIGAYMFPFRGEGGISFRAEQ